MSTADSRSGRVERQSATHLMTTGNRSKSANDLKTSRWPLQLSNSKELSGSVDAMGI